MIIWNIQACLNYAKKNYRMMIRYDFKIIPWISFLSFVNLQNSQNFYEFLSLIWKIIQSFHGFQIFG